MSRQNEPDDKARSEDEAELTRTFHRIASALERGDVDELAAALSEEPDPAWLGPASHGPPKES